MLLYYSKYPDQRIHVKTESGSADLAGGDWYNAPPARSAEQLPVVKCLRWSGYQECIKASSIFHILNFNYNINREINLINYLKPYLLAVPIGIFLNE